MPSWFAPAPQQFIEHRLHAHGVPAGTLGDYMAEVNRITSLPIQQAITPEEHEAACRVFQLANAPSKLNVHQVAAALAWCNGLGVFGTLAVGTGKTLLLQLLASLARQEGHERIVLLLPNGLTDELLVRQMPWIRTMIPVRHEIAGSFEGLTKRKRHILASSGRRGLYIIPYSLMSTRDDKHPDLLTMIRPTVVLSDECFNLKNVRSSACARRVMRYVRENRPRFAAVAGTVTEKGPDDYAHTANAALGEASPLPLDPALIQAWSLVISAGAVPAGAQAAPLRPLLLWARENYPEAAGELPEEIAGFRKAFALRLTSAPGVIATTEASCGASLVYCNEPVEGYESNPGWPRLKELIERSYKPLQVTPNNEPIDHAMHAFKWRYELAAGMYNEMVFPTPEVLAERRGVTLPEADKLLEAGQEALAAEQEYHKFLREWFDEGDHRNRHGKIMDTPMEVGEEMASNGAAHVGIKLYQAWRLKKYHEAQVEAGKAAGRDKRAVRVCDFRIRAAARWVRGLPKGEGALIWAHNREMVTWAAELLAEEFGDRVRACRDHPADREFICTPEAAQRIVVASIKVYHAGFNLQGFPHVLFLQSPRSAKYWEQTVGRVHRQGQTRDVVRVTTMHTLKEDWAVFSAAAIDALYQHQAGGGPQKLIYGSYDPLPETLPPEVLLEMGAITRAAMPLGRALAQHFGRA